MILPLQSEVLKDSRINHGFFSRRGGCSTGIYEGLNCGLGSHDDPENVEENRKRVANYLKVEVEGLLTPYQVHSSDAVIVEANDRAGWIRPKADAVVTKDPSIGVGILTADCTPVLFADIQNRIVGAAHAGWRGAYSGILSSTVDAMIQLGAQRDKINVAIGPTISQKNYEVGPEFEAQFCELSPEFKEFFAMGPAGKAHFDLPAFVKKQLEDMHIGSIDDCGHCTYELEKDYFSYRRTTHRGEVDYGRQIAAISLTE